MIRRPPRSTRTDTLFPYTALFRSVADAQAVLDASAHNMVIAGLPSETADALVAWLDDPANAALLLRSANAQAELRALLPAGDGTKAGPLEGKTRSEERRVGNECVSTCSSRGSPYH